MTSTHQNGPNPPLEAAGSTEHPIDGESTFRFSAISPSPDPQGSGKRLVALTQALRILGSMLLVTAASIFMIQQWSAGSDIYRYLLLLAFTGLLWAAGIFCGLRIQESKGARTLLGLALVMVPPLYSILGGLVHSLNLLEPVTRQLPTFAIWVAPSPLAVAGTVLGTIALILPLSYVSILTLGRPFARWITGAFFAGNMLLLVPVRAPLLVALFAVAMSALLAFGELRRFRHQPAMNTLEGKGLRLLLWLPVSILVGRTFLLYHPTSLFLGILWAIAAFLLFTVTPPMFEQQKHRELLENMALAPATLSWGHLAYAIWDSFSLGPQAALPLFCLPLAGILMGTSCFARYSGNTHRRLAAVVATGGVAVNFLLFSGLPQSFLLLTVSVVVFAYGFHGEQKAFFLSGLVGILISLGYYMAQAVHHYSFGSWGSLAALGVLIILAASLLERKYACLVRGLAQLKNRVRSWEY